MGFQQRQCGARFLPITATKKTFAEWTADWVASPNDDVRLIPEIHANVFQKAFDTLNERFFHGLLGRPQLTWSEHNAKRLLGHYDAAHNTIVVSKVFDRPSSPRYAIEYLLYHEMLHLKHPVKLRGSRRCVHSAEFQREEKLFPRLAEANAFLKRL